MVISRIWNNGGGICTALVDPKITGCTSIRKNLQLPHNSRHTSKIRDEGHCCAYGDLCVQMIPHKSCASRNLLMHKYVGDPAIRSFVFLCKYIAASSPEPASSFKYNGCSKKCTETQNMSCACKNFESYFICKRAFNLVKFCVLNSALGQGRHLKMRFKILPNLKLKGQGPAYLKDDNIIIKKWCPAE